MFIFINTQKYCFLLAVLTYRLWVFLLGVVECGVVWLTYPNPSVENTVSWLCITNRQTVDGPTFTRPKFARQTLPGHCSPRQRSPDQSSPDKPCQVTAPHANVCQTIVRDTNVLQTKVCQSNVLDQLSAKQRGQWTNGVLDQRGHIDQQSVFLYLSSLDATFPAVRHSVC